MRYLGVVFWSFVISSLLGYVLTNMAGEPFTLTPILALTVIFSLIVTIVGDGILTKQDTNETVE